MKFCSLCKEEKALTDFPLRKGSKDGYRAECKQCKSKRDSLRHAERMSDPFEKEREALRLREFRKSLSDDKKEMLRQNQLARAKRLVKNRQDNFLTKHGCTRQALKWKQGGEAFIADGILRNGPNKYGYFAVDYQGVWKPVIIWCNTHKKYFTQSPKYHKLGQGCPECGKIATGNALRRSQETFIKQAQAFCGDKFTFNDAVYVDNVTHVQVTCKVHGNFPIKPGNLLSGKGCPDCAEHGYRNNIPGSLYVLHNGELTKIGITNNSVTSRVKQINRKGKDFRVVATFPFVKGIHASLLETTLLRELRENYLQPVEKFDGSTECFFGLDPYELAKEIKARLPQHTEETKCQLLTHPVTLGACV